MLLRISKSAIFIISLILLISLDISAHSLCDPANYYDPYAPNAYSVAKAKKKYHYPFNGFNQKHRTMESEHFKAHYPAELKSVAEEIIAILENLHDIYKNTYQITLPGKTEVLVSNDDQSGGWAMPFRNILHIWANDFDWNMRGTPNWLENVVAHEYAHIVSISIGNKLPQVIPYVQYGKVTHPNQKFQPNIVHAIPNDILPPWFTEGIAQFESSRNNGDKWDSHRDMMLRTLAASNKLISWAHMQVFSAEKSYEYELTYNHGFSLIRYMVEKYGYGSIVSIIRESSKFTRFNFDRSIKAVLGITAKQLYSDWKDQTTDNYLKDIRALGDQVYGELIYQQGFNNINPIFGPRDSLLYFNSNGENSFGGRNSPLSILDLSTLDTTELDKRKVVIPNPEIISTFDIDKNSYRVLYTSFKSPKSRVSYKKGGVKTSDLYIEQLQKPGDKKKLFSKNKKRQITYQFSAFKGVFSPTADSIVVSKHKTDNFELYLLDTTGEKSQCIYPPKNKPELKIYSIYNLKWSPAGNYIALDYLDRDNRKIGLYEVATGKFFNLCDTKYDEREPNFSKDGNTIYFSSDRTGIFNIYRYNITNETLERITNVVGGAFSSDISKDNKKLVYSGFNENLYGIYMIDSIIAVSKIKLSKQEAIVERKGYMPKKIATENMMSRKYSKLPRQFNIIPMLYSDQVLTKKDNPFAGESSFKIGALAWLVDPLFWKKRGSQILAYLMLDPSEFIFTTGEIINRKSDFDLGILGHTDALPVTIEFSHLRRGISGKDYFYDEYYSENLLLDYNLNPTFTQLVISTITEDGSTTDIGFTGFRIAANFDYSKFNVWIKPNIPGTVTKYFSYSPTKGMNTGLSLGYGVQTRYPRMGIAPRAFVFDIRYNFFDQKMQNDYNSFDSQNRENYLNPYKYHEITSNLLFNLKVPFSKNVSWLRDHVLLANIAATAVSLTQKSKNKLQENVDDGYLPSIEIPSYMEPGVILPGYTYYYKDTTYTVLKQTDYPNSYDTTAIYSDTVLISGKGVISAGLSYSFPLYNGLIDKKLGFLYFKYLYGVFNIGAATAVEDINNLKNLSRSDILMFTGAEVRLSTIAFSSFPLNISARWDYGLDRPAPIGGHRFILDISFDFAWRNSLTTKLSRNRLYDMKKSYSPFSTER